MIESGGLTPCVGCGGLVPEMEGPTHRYMESSPGCWALYGGLLVRAGGDRAWSRYDVLTVDAYAVQHPGVPGPKSTQSVWVHLITLHMVLERGWRPDQVIRIRTVAADGFGGWPWLTAPASMGEVTVVDVTAGAEDVAAPDVVQRWVEGSWAAWADHQLAVREQAEALFPLT